MEAPTGLILDNAEDELIFERVDGGITLSLRYEGTKRQGGMMLTVPLWNHEARQLLAWLKEQFPEE